MKKLLSLILFWFPFFIFSQTISISKDRGFYEFPLNLELSTDILGGTIRYTLDGSQPSITTGIIYGGIPFVVNTTTVVRAIAYSGLIKSSVKTNSYVFLDDVIHQPLNINGWPNNVYELGSGNATAIHDYEMDPDVVNNPAYSNIIKQGLLSIPTMSIVMLKDDFWEMYDGEAGFPGSVEILYPNHQFPDEQFDAEMESHSHLRLKRSMKIDINNSVNSNLLKTNPVTGNTATTNFTNTKFVLRAGNNRAWSRNWNPDKTVFTRDEWYRSSQLAASGIGMRGTFVHLYVNGLYWGLYNPVQRQDAGFMSTYFGGEPQDWMTLSHNGINSGDATRFNYLTTTLVNKNMAVQASYEEVKQYIDVEKFIDYLMITWSMGLTDWPANNFYGGNRNNPAEPFNYYTWDGEWSWDTTNGSNNGAWVHPSFINGVTGTEPISKIWHSLRASPQFMQLFADRVNLQFFNNGPLSDANSRARWESINQFIENAVVAESARWGDALNDGKTRTKNNDWQPEVVRVDGLMNGNANRFVTALRAQGYYPSLDAPTFNKPAGSVSSSFKLIVNNPNLSGTIYYTTDGSDPKLANGDVSTSAQTFTGPLAIPTSAILNITARIKNGSEWSASSKGKYAGIKLFINEFMASNATGITDELGVNEDWIEFYNAGVLPVDIGGMYITDDFSNYTKWQIPNTSPNATTIPAGGFLYVWADNEPGQGPLHMNIKLSGSGEAIAISIQGATQIETIDSFSFGLQASDISMGRYPDGGPKFFTFDKPTPGAANELGFVSGIYINEFLASNINGTADEFGHLKEDWIEIYNNNNAPVDIGGMYITDTPSTPLLCQLPTDNPTATTIPAGGFIILWADGKPLEGSLHVNLKLSKSGENIILTQVLGSESQVIDSLTFGAQTDDVSTGRAPDGGITFRTYFQPTPGASNLVPFIKGLSINEALVLNATSIADTNGEKDPWIEIYNRNATPVNIGGLFVSNNAGNPSLWQIPKTNPTLTTIPAGGFITLWADNQVVQGELHVPFTLSSVGGTILISDIIGTDVSTIDTMNYPSQTTDISFGRYPDASPQFKSFSAPTPNNNNVLPLVKDIYINEFLAGNSVTNTDDFGEFEDWVELYNAGNKSVDVGGLFLVDNLDETNPFQIPTTSPLQTTIAPGGFLLLWCDNSPFQGVLHMNIKLSSGGEDIGLLQKNGNERNFIDSLTYLSQVDNVSHGRSTDGGPTFVNFTSPTPKASNGGNIAHPLLKIMPSSISETLLVGQTKVIIYQVNPEDGSSIPTPAVMTIIDNATGQIANWASTTSAANQSIPYNITLNATGLSPGIYTATMTAGSVIGYSDGSIPITLTVAVPPALSILGLELINATTDFSLGLLNNGMLLNINNLPSLNLDVKSNVTSDVKSVKFQLSGSKSQIQLESVLPYALFGDVNGNYNGSNFTIGSYNLTVTPYSASNQSGTIGIPLTISFQIVSGPVDNDGDGFNSGVDCNDNNASIYPGALEICDGNDNNCNGVIDEGIALTMYYADIDGDGYGNPTTVVSLCKSAPGYVLDHTDCNDNNASIYPGALEICDGKDNNCNGVIDEGIAFTMYYADIDGDGYGNPSTAVSLCKSAPGFVLNHTDCNDNNASVHPASIEICDGIDNNCDGLIDGAETGVSCSTALSIVGLELINATTDVSLGLLTNGMILNTNNLPSLNLDVKSNVTSDVKSVKFQLSGSKAQIQLESVLPYALFGDVNGNYNGSNFTTGSYNLIVTPYSASNQSGTIGTPLTISFQIVSGLVDNDGDGFNSGVDCNDNNASIYPGALEICDGKDNNCNGAIDEGLALSMYYADIDGDGYGNPSTAVSLCKSASGYVLNHTDCNDNNASVHPGSIEICDGIDNNCDGLIDGAETGVSCTKALSILGLELINATADVSLGSLTSGMILNTNNLPSLNLDVKSNVTSDVKSVKFQLSGSKSQIQLESVLPYALFGDVNGNYNGSNFTTGNYNLTVTPYSGSNQSGTTGIPLTISFQIINTTGKMFNKKGSVEIKEVQEENKIKVYPNPASDILFIEFESLKAKEATISLYNLIGQLVYNIDLKGDFNHLQELDLRRLSDGVYILRMTGKDGDILITDRVAIKRK